MPIIRSQIIKCLAITGANSEFERHPVASIQEDQSILFGMN